jgi:hypothetical protein
VTHRFFSATAFHIFPNGVNCKGRGSAEKKSFVRHSIQSARHSEEIKSMGTRAFCPNAVCPTRGLDKVFAKDEETESQSNDF